MFGTHDARSKREMVTSLRERALGDAEAWLNNFDLSVAMEERITEGPRGDLDSYLACIDRLHDAVKFFHDRSNFRSAEPAWRHAYGLLDKVRE